VDCPMTGAPGLPQCQVSRRGTKNLHRHHIVGDLALAWEGLEMVAIYTHLPADMPPAAG
jgi:hypothetical protein